MIQNFPLLSQNDKKWKAVKLGTSSVTIGGYGCLITCVSMLCTYYGLPTNPDSLNHWLIDNKGYASGNLYLWDSILQFTYHQIGHSGQTTALDGSEPCIIQVDFYPATDYPDMHWVVYLGNDMCADPWDGTVKNISAYGGRKKVKTIHIFKNNVQPPQPTTGGSSMDRGAEADRNWKYYTALRDPLQALYNLGDKEEEKLQARIIEEAKNRNDQLSKTTAQLFEQEQKLDGLRTTNKILEDTNKTLKAENEVLKNKICPDVPKTPLEAIQLALKLALQAKGK